MTRGVRSPLLVVCALLGAATSIHAQLAAALEAGASRVAFDEGAASTAFSLTPSLQWERQNLTLLTLATYSSFPSGGWSLQGAASGSWLAAATSPVKAEIGVFASGSTSESAGNSEQFLARSRLHWSGDRLGTWLGVGGGWGGFESERTGSVSLEGAAWLRAGRATLIGSVVPVYVGDDRRYVDGQIDAQVPLWRLLIQSQIGVRGWSRPESEPSRAWGNVTALLPLSTHLALVGSGGSYPEDAVQELPSGSFVSISLRLTTGRIPRPEPGPLVRSQRREPLSRPVALELTARRDREMVTFRVRAPEANSVDIMGDFTRWKAQPMSRAKRDRWEWRVPLPPGQYRVNLRVDGGPWGTPAGMTTVEDEFGGVVGLLLIP